MKTLLFAVCFFFASMVSAFAAWPDTPELFVTGLDSPTIFMNTVMPSRFAVVTTTFNLQLASVGSTGINGFADDYAFQLNSFHFVIYRNGIKLDLQNVVAKTSFTIPSAGVTTSGLPEGSIFGLQGNNMVTVPVTFTFSPSLTDPGLAGEGAYAVGFDYINFIDGSGTLRRVDSLVTGSQAVTNYISLGYIDVHGFSSAIPEPSTYAMMVGVCVLGFVFWRRQKMLRLK